MIRLEEITWVEFDQLDRDKTVVWIPVSPIEAHGPHLPLGTDLFGARDMAEVAADLLVESDASLKAVVAPAIPLGGCRVTADFPGTLSVRGSTLARVMIDVCEALAGHGFHYLVIANHHLDPVHMKAILVAVDEVGARFPDLRIIEVMSRVVYAGAETETTRQGRAMGLDMTREIHADVRETAYIRHRYPHLLKAQPRPLPPVSIDVRSGFRKGLTTFKQMGAAMGYLGSPEAATEALGRLHLEENARMAADLALKLIRGEQLPEIPPKIRHYLDNQVELD